MIEDILNERQKTHGSFSVHALATQEMKEAMRGYANWEVLNPSQRESLEMIAHKIGRILAGDPNHKDHWADIAGYATLCANQLTD